MLFSLVKIYEINPKLNSIKNTKSNNKTSKPNLHNISCLKGKLLVKHQKLNWISHFSAQKANIKLNFQLHSHYFMPRLFQCKYWNCCFDDAGVGGNRTKAVYFFWFFWRNWRCCLILVLPLFVHSRCCHLNYETTTKS